MSFKVVRDAEGRTIAYGPNSDHYEPGQGYAVEAEAPAIWADPKDAIRAQITDLEAKQLLLMARFQRESTLQAAEDEAMRLAGLSPEALYAMGSEPDAATTNTAAYNYVQLKNLDNQIKEKRDQL